MERDRAWATKTVSIQLSAVRSFYSWAVRTGGPSMSAATEVSERREVRTCHRKRDPLTPAEVRALLATCERGQAIAGTRYRAMIGLLAFFGLRGIEMHRANVENARTMENRILLEVWGKGRNSADEIEESLEVQVMAVTHRSIRR